MPQRKKAKSKKNKATPTDPVSETDGTNPELSQQSEVESGVNKNSTDGEWKLESGHFC